MPLQTTKNAAYDNAVSLARSYVTLPVSAAGASGTFGKYYARGNEYLWSAQAFQSIAGTSTYTTTSTYITNGTTATTTNTHTAATQVTAYRVSGTTTTTYQPFTVATSNTTNGTMSLNNFTATATSATGGGTALVAGDLLYMLNGTDTTATSLPMWEMSVAPLANVTM